MQRLLLILAVTLALPTARARADEKEADNCLRAKIWAGYKDGWAVRTASTLTLERTQHRVYLLTLLKGKAYKFLVCGDSRARNLDLILHDTKGKEIKRDKTSTPTPSLTYEPKATGTYYVAVHATDIAKGAQNTGVALAVVYR